MHRSPNSPIITHLRRRHTAPLQVRPTVYCSLNSPIITHRARLAKLPYYHSPPSRTWSASPGTAHNAPLAKLARLAYYYSPEAALIMHVMCMNHFESIFLVRRWFLWNSCALIHCYDLHCDHAFNDHTYNDHAYNDHAYNDHDCSDHATRAYLLFFTVIVSSQSVHFEIDLRAIYTWMIHTGLWKSCACSVAMVTMANNFILITALWFVYPESYRQNL